MNRSDEIALIEAMIVPVIIGIMAFITLAIFPSRVAHIRFTGFVRDACTGFRTYGFAVIGDSPYPTKSLRYRRELW